MHSARRSDDLKTGNRATFHATGGISRRFVASAGMGHSVAAGIVRHSFFGWVVWSSRIHWRLPVDRSCAPAFGHVADQPHLAKPNVAGDPPGSTACARCHRRSAGGVTNKAAFVAKNFPSTRPISETNLLPLGKQKSTVPKSKYPPAEPGALVCEPLEAAVRGRSRGPDVLGHLRVATSAPHVQLIQALVLFLLRADVLSNQRLVPPHRGHEVSPRPETLPPKILLPSSVHSCQVNRTLPFDKPDHLRHGVLGRDRNHHVYVIRQQMPFLNPAFLLLRQFAEHLSQILPQFPIQRLPATLRDKHHMVFALPFRVA